MQSDAMVRGEANTDTSGGRVRADRTLTASTGASESRTAAPRADLVRQIAALGLGAAAMYFLDPKRGRRRRHLVRDKLVHAANRSADVVGDETADVLPHQGENQPAKATFELLQESWTPAARLIAGVTGGVVAAISLRDGERRKPLSTAIGLVGAALAVRSATNLSFYRLLGVGAGRRVVTVQKSITIAAPIYDVFTWLVAWERWPRWTSRVREVRSRGGSGAVGERTHWVVDGPAGTMVEWDAETTRFVPPALIAWRTIDGSPVAHAGTIQLARTDAGATRLDVTISYTTIGGAAGHAVASLFRRDPEHQLEDELARLRTTIETGKPPQDAAVADRQAVESFGQ